MLSERFHVGREGEEYTPERNMKEAVESALLIIEEALTQCRKLRESA